MPWHRTRPDRCSWGIRAELAGHDSSGIGGAMATHCHFSFFVPRACADLSFPAQCLPNLAHDPIHPCGAHSRWALARRRESFQAGRQCRDQQSVGVAGWRSVTALLSARPLGPGGGHSGGHRWGAGCSIPRKTRVTPTTYTQLSLPVLCTGATHPQHPSIASRSLLGSPVYLCKTKLWRALGYLARLSRCPRTRHAIPACMGGILGGYPAAGGVSNDAPRSVVR